MGDVLGVPLDTGDNGVRERPLLGSLVSLLNDDNLLSGLSTSEDDRNLSGLVN